MVRRKDHRERHLRGNLLTRHYVTVLDVILSPKRTNRSKWNVDVSDVTLEGLKEYIRKENEPSSHIKISVKCSGYSYLVCQLYSLDGETEDLTIVDFPW
ncbi:hypothetical protein RclHR1_01550034 [Rhizophagus clarus]|uniref:Uncharacterized protein n=1 Tax=Rhizophagus clarus TaxID=94130 RepID=A0A2Z6QFI5_9GLOM|nr:hypothetical protein RclHR1_01550034 [Rhizophagus clarus]GET03459.1 hypothetical protein GLOIN_2v1872036 [Rhizophagus clarus]